MLRTAGDIVSEFSLSRCVRCGACDNVCPSGRNGGIHPDEVIYALIDADALSDAKDIRADVWKCLMCHRCSMDCPEGIDVTGAVRSLRYMDAVSGNSPKRFRAASETLVREGRAFPVNDIVDRKRAELGLEELSYDTDSVNELRKIMSATGFRYE
ncbi:MAG: 4Fe-4S dicluster domain-containing protein [Methanomassiliicoccaceae archaeon]|jgi:heterodisulfide reductase subunit C|nr:4Fe-4S dicluster domain-containing protein [Methanomassiliicoccaceae archaeon]